METLQSAGSLARKEAGSDRPGGRRAAIGDRGWGENRSSFALNARMAGDHRDFRPPDPAELETLWGWGRLSGRDRSLLLDALERDPALYEELEFLLRRVGREVREEFVLAFIDSLDGAPRPAAAVMPALVHASRALEGTARRGGRELLDGWMALGGGDGGQG